MILKFPRLLPIMLIIPGFTICLIVSVMAKFITDIAHIPVMMLALLFGMVLHFLSKAEMTKDGVQYTSKNILRLGVILIGARVVFSDFMALGYGMIAIVVITTIVVILIGVFLAKILGADKEQGILIGSATAICGASAALAISATMPHSKTLEKNTLIAVVGVTAIGTIAMILYPIIITISGLNDYQAGILIGGAIHDVAQVVGAGYSVSEEAGDTAVIIKLIRVSMLVPIIFAFAFMFGRKEIAGNSKTPLIPLFIIGFITLVMLNSFQIIPLEINNMLKEISNYLLLMAITAVGMKTSFKSLLSLGWKPMAILLIEAIIIFGIYFAVVISPFV